MLYILYYGINFSSQLMKSLDFMMVCYGNFNGYDTNLINHLMDGIHKQ